MNQEDDNKPGIAEQYSNATHASSLVVDAERNGAADKLIAAAWSKSRLGAALLRLHSEADGTAEPQRLHERGIQIMALDIAMEEAKALARKTGKPLDRAEVKPTAANVMEARIQAGEWYLHEQGLRLQRLKTLPEVRDQLASWAWASNIPKPLDVAVSALIWWLSSRCHVCHGQRWEVIPDTNRLSQRPCTACHGTGERVKPDGALTSMMLTYMADCINASRAEMQKRLRAYQTKKD